MLIPLFSLNSCWLAGLQLALHHFFYWLELFYGFCIFARGGNSGCVLYLHDTHFLHLFHILFVLLRQHMLLHIMSPGTLILTPSARETKKGVIIFVHMSSNTRHISLYLIIVS